jgi:hypothetical protein
MKGIYFENPLYFWLFLLPLLVLLYNFLVQKPKKEVVPCLFLWEETKTPLGKKNWIWPLLCFFLFASILISLAIPYTQKKNKILSSC